MLAVGAQDLSSDEQLLATLFMAQEVLPVSTKREKGREEDAGRPGADEVAREGGAGAGLPRQSSLALSGVHREILA